MSEEMQIIKALAEQVPGLLVLGWIVVQFLRHNRTVAESFTKRMVERDADMKAVAEETREALDRATEIFGEVRALLDHIVRTNGIHKGV